MVGGPARTDGDLVSESWYRDGSCVVLVVTGQPSDSVRVGVGEPSRDRATGRRIDAYANARRNLQLTALQSTGPDSGVAAALRWAHRAGWVSDPTELKDDDGPEEIDLLDADTNETIGAAGPELVAASLAAGPGGIVLARRDERTGDWIHVADPEEDFWRRIRRAEVRQVYVLGPETP